MPLLHDVINAYLAPLLKKHSVGEVLTFVDLTNSKEAAKAVMADSPNEFVMKRVQNLHDSQVKAYEDTAKTSLGEWVQQSATLPSVQKGEIQEAFIARCYKHVKSSRPNWHLSESQVEECLSKITTKRATQIYQASPNAIPTSPTPSQPALPSSSTKKMIQHSRTFSNDSQESGAIPEEEEEGEVEEQPPQNDDEEEGEMAEEGDATNNNNNEEEEEGEEDEEDGEVAEDNEGGDEEVAEKKTTTAAGNKRKKPQQNRGTTKKRAVRRTSGLKKKTSTASMEKKTSTGGGRGGKKVVRKKVTKKGGGATNNKSS